MKKLLVACALVSVTFLGCKKEVPDKEPTNASGARMDFGSGAAESLAKKKAENAGEAPAQ